MAIPSPSAEDLAPPLLAGLAAALLGLSWWALASPDALVPRLLMPCLALPALILALLLKRHLARLCRLAGGDAPLSALIRRREDDLQHARAALDSAEARLGRFLARLPNPIWEWQPASDRWYVSPGLPAQAGCDARPLPELIHPEDRERVLSAWREALADGRPARQEFRLCQADGWRWHAAWASPAADGASLGGTLEDIETQRQAARSEQALRDHLARQTDMSADGLWDWEFGATGQPPRYRYSPRYAALLGLAAPELPDGREGFLGRVHPEDRPRVEAELDHHLSEGMPFDSEFRLRHKDGTHLWVKARGEVDRDAAGRISHSHGACRDITPLRQAMDNIRALVAEKQAMLDNALIGILQCRGSVIASSNGRVRELLGFDGHDLFGKALDVLFPSAAAWERLHQDASAALAQGRRYAGEADLRRKDGAPLRCLVTVCPQAGGGNGSLWMLADLSRQKQAVDALRLERDFSNALISHLPGVFCLLDRDGRILRWNANFELQTRFTAREILRLRWEDCCPPEERSIALALTDKARAEGAATALMALRDRDGRAVPHHFTCVHVAVEGEEHLALQGLDMTEREQAALQIHQLNTELEERVKRRTAELQSANLELESFSYSVSHDLNAPLRGIAGFSRMLEQDCGTSLDALGRSYLERIQAATVRMQQLIDDLLNLSRISRNEMDKSEIDISRMVSEIVSELRQADPQRKVEVAVAEGLVATADRNLLQIALDNLLRNAWKFTRQKEVAHITFGIMDKNGGPVYFVRDDGAGFDMQYASRLFRAFERLHRVSEFEGTGIGLAIVNRIIHRHGGKIWVEAEERKGATFYFTLPDKRNDR